ncbi:MAG: hypothetical protein ACYC26_15500 [Phycisphaerales bacterium]
MIRRWLHSVDIAYDPATGSILTAPASAGAIHCGTKTVAAAATPEQLVSALPPGVDADQAAVCSVWIGSRVDANGNAQNTLPCFIGDAAIQTLPLLPSNYEGFFLRIDPRKLYVKVGVNGQGVNYAIFL